MRKVIARLALLACLVPALCMADEPGKKPAVRPAATTKPLEPGDVGQTTVAPSPADGPLPVAVRWWGHACVSIETFWGLTIVIDPYSENPARNYPKLNLNADLVLVSHDAPDHSAVGAVAGSPPVLRGVLDGGRRWAEIDHVLDRPANAPAPSLQLRAQAASPSPHAVFVKGVGARHDPAGGDEDDLEMMFLVETNGVRVLHCGDLGHRLSPEQLKAVGEVDVLILPVGGNEILDAARAVDVARQVNPRAYIWPVHFAADSAGAVPEAVDAIIAESRRANLLTRTVAGNTLAVTALPPDAPPLIGRPAVVLSDYRPLEPERTVRQMLKSLRGDRKTLIDNLGKVTREQLDHRPSDGSHTIRWNFEHTTARELGLFSQIYHALDPGIPVINWNPAQMPRDFVPRHPDWGPDEIVRHVRRVGAFTERFSYLLADAPPTMRIEGTRFSLDYLTALIVGHYQNHMNKAVHKFTLPDWPRKPAAP